MAFSAAMSGSTEAVINPQAKNSVVTEANAPALAFDALLHAFSGALASLALKKDPSLALVRDGSPARSIRAQCPTATMPQGLPPTAI